MQSDDVPRVALMEGNTLSMTGGMGQAAVAMVTALQRVAGVRYTIITPDGRRVPAVGQAQQPMSLPRRARRRAIRLVQERTALPLLRWLTGTHDVYHYIGTSLRPCVPHERLIISTFDLGGERWPDEVPYPPWAAAVLRRAARIMTISQFSKTELYGYFGLSQDQVDVVYPGCDHARFNSAPDAGDEGYVRAAIGGAVYPYLLCAGGQTQRKNVRRLLHAYARFLRATGSQCHLLITGVVPLSQAGLSYTTLARTLGISSRVILPGYLPAHVMPALYRRADAVVVPSLYEGFGLPVIQAMACGTPVLSSNVSSLPEVAGGAALCVDATSTDQLAAGLARIVGDDGLRASLRRKGIERASAFTWERCAAQTIAIYQDVARRAGVRRRRVVTRVGTVI